MVRKHKHLSITKSQITAVTKTTKLDIANPKPVKVIRWTDSSSVKQEIYLHSDNYPNLPSQRQACLSKFIIGGISSKISNSSYWYNHYHSLAPLIGSVSAALNVYANLTKNSYSNLRDRVSKCTVFFDWLLLQRDINIPTSIYEITRPILLRFRDYLYREHDTNRLSKGGINDKVWQLSVPGLLKYFAERPSCNFLHPSISAHPFPIFSSGRGAGISTVIPYSDFEMWEIIVAADNACSLYMHNWKLMRQIDQMRIGDWNNLEDICWVIVNVEWEQRSNKSFSNKASRHYKLLYDNFGITYDQFYARFSEADIRKLAANGNCPYRTFMTSTLECLSDSGRLQLARSWVRKSLDFLFDARRNILSAPNSPDWNTLFCSDGPLSFRLRRLKNNMSATQRKVFWEAAGFQHLREFDVSMHAFASLFFPTTDAIYPFHLFVMAESGVNMEVVNSIDRYAVLSDLDPDNAVYRGVKKRTGKCNHRNEEIVVPRSEDKGIAERIEFIKAITEPFLKYCSKNVRPTSLWIGLTLNNSSNRQFVSLNDQYYSRVNSRFCVNYGLQEIRYGAKGEWAKAVPLTYIMTRRLRKSNVLKDMAELVPYHIIQAALADNSFETVYKWYIDNSVQRQINFNAIAAIQEVLMKEIKSYSRLDKFAGSIIYDTPLSKANDITDNLLSACISPLNDENKSAADNGFCLPPKFDACLGCKNSRVFREHLPGICFRILQYDDKKKALSPHTWEASYSLHRSRAIDCLEKYAKNRKTYSIHVDAAWIIAKTEGGVFLPPLT